MFTVRRFEPTENTGGRPGKKRKATALDSPPTTSATPSSPPAVDDLPDAASDAITVLNRRKAEKLRLRATHTPPTDDVAVDATDDIQRQQRKEAKREKRRARRSSSPGDAPFTDAPLSHLSPAVDLQPLLALKNSTRARDDSKAPPLPPPSLPSSSLPSPPSPKHQRRKDPQVRAAERQARKRARDLQQRRDRGEAVDEDAEANIPTFPAVPPVAEHKEAESDEQQGKEAEPAPPFTAPPAAGDEAEAREQRRLAARPNWMARGLHIDPTASLPITALALHPALLSSLHSAGIPHLFPVQAQVIPLVLPLRASHDVCVSSPTGSGKTLIYILPILHALAGKTLPLLRAVVIVPSRGLAQQVWREMAAYARGVGVRVGLSVGGGSFRKEQLALVRPHHTRQSRILTGEDWAALDEGAGGWGGVDGDGVGAEGEVWDSGVDVLVTTPGRLMDHLEGTAGFSLRHLEFLVIDEVDRLLTQHYQDWPQRVWEAMQPLPRGEGQGRAGEVGVQWDTTAPATCQKLLLSATLTGHPAKLASLHLRNPVLFIDSQSRQKRYSIPQGLAASFYLCEASEKPLLLLQLLTSLPLVRTQASTGPSTSRVMGDQALVFTSSLDACHRVARLLSLWGGMTSAEYSSALSQKARDALLAAFRRREVAVLVCSDVMARGMDIGGVSVVVNYDVPLYIQTYVHRVGRTARGGGEGRAVTLLKRAEYRHFMLMVRKAANSFMQREVQDKERMEGMQDRYRRVLAQLADVIRKERRGRMGTLDKVAALGEGKGDTVADEEEEVEGEKDEEEGVDRREWTFTGLSRRLPTKPMKT